MSVTAKDQYENLLIERNELKREVEKYKMERVLIDAETTRLKSKVSQLGQRAEKAESESAEARGNVEKALRELSEEVAKRHKVEAKCAEMRDLIRNNLRAFANVGKLLDAETVLSSDCGSSYVPKAELDAAEKLAEEFRLKIPTTAQVMVQMRVQLERDKLRETVKQLVEALGQLPLRYSEALNYEGPCSCTATEPKCPFCLSWSQADSLAEKALAAAKEVL